MDYIYGACLHAGGFPLSDGKTIVIMFCVVIHTSTHAIHTLLIVHSGSNHSIY